MAGSWNCNTSTTLQCISVFVCMCLTKAPFPQAITESDLVLHSQRWRSNIFIAFVRKIQYCTAAPADTPRGRQISKIQFLIYYFYRLFPWTWIKMSTKFICVSTKLKWFNLENFVIVSIFTLHRILCKINHWYCMEAVGHIFVVAHQREAIKDLVWNTLGASRHTILS